MASLRNQHCASCIGTLSYPMLMGMGMNVAGMWVAFSQWHSHSRRFISNSVLCMWDKRDEDKDWGMKKSKCEWEEIRFKILLSRTSSMHMLHTL